MSYDMIKSSQVIDAKIHLDNWSVVKHSKINMIKCNKNKSNQEMDTSLSALIERLQLLQEGCSVIDNMIGNSIGISSDK